jgi:hypothetical protein
MCMAAGWMTVEDDSEVRAARRAAVRFHGCLDEEAALRLSGRRFIAMWGARVISCSFCRAETGFIAEGPDVSICESCVNEAIAGVPRVGATNGCSFCRRDGNILLTNASDDVRICSECIQIARDVVEHQRTKAMRSN